MEHSEVVSKINEALEEIRPFLKSDGGDIAFIKMTEDNVVHVEFLGACTGCSVNQMTLKSGVEMTIKKYLPQVKQVVDVSKAGAL